MGETEVDCVVVDLEPEKEKALNPELGTGFLPCMILTRLKIVWVKGHAGHPENERCDRTCRCSRKTICITINLYKGGYKMRYVYADNSATTAHFAEGA